MAAVNLQTGLFAIQHMMLALMYKEISTSVPAMIEGRIEDPPTRGQVIGKWIFILTTILSGPLNWYA